MANHPGRRKISPPAAAPEGPRHLIQTRVNDQCEEEINRRCEATGLSQASWLRMFLYEQLGITPKKD